MKKYRRGDWNKAHTKQFWGYIKNAEGWMDPKKFEEAQERTKYWTFLAYNNPKLLKKLRNQRYKQTKKK